MPVWCGFIFLILLWCGAGCVDGGDPFVACLVRVMHVQMVILDIPDSGAFYVYDGDNITAEMIQTFIGFSPSTPEYPILIRLTCE